MVETTEIKHEGEEAMAYGDFRPVKRNRSESEVFFLSLLGKYLFSHLLGPGILV